MHQLFTDGGARGNPGPAAIGALLFDAKNELVELDAQYLGKATNNEAEYKALLMGLDMALKHERESITCFLDSELVVMQLNGAYQVKVARLKELHKEAKALADQFDEVKFVHVRREKNKFADKLVNVTLDAVDN